MLCPPPPTTPPRSSTLAVAKLPLPNGVGVGRMVIPWHRRAAAKLVAPLRHMFFYSKCMVLSHRDIMSPSSNVRHTYTPRPHCWLASQHPHPYNNNTKKKPFIHAFHIYHKYHTKRKELTHQHFPYGQVGRQAQV